MKISVVIITSNEEKKLEAALRSVADLADEVVVVDSYSADRTFKIAKKYTSKVFQRKWTNFADQKNFANIQASNPWILSLDADERVSPELRAEILQIKETEPECSAFSFPLLGYYIGKWIRHSGWSQDRMIRLFRRDEAYWEGESVHEKLVVKGKIEKLKGPLHHFIFRSIADHLARINTYSEFDAQKLYIQRKKPHLSHFVFLPFFRFVKTFFLRFGFLDGFPGLVISVLSGYDIFIRYAKLKEIWKRGERIESFPY